MKRSKQPSPAAASKASRKGTKKKATKKTTKATKKKVATKKASKKKTSQAASTRAVAKKKKVTKKKVARKKTTAKKTTKKTTKKATKKATKKQAQKTTAKKTAAKKTTAKKTTAKKTTAKKTTAKKKASATQPSMPTLTAEILEPRIMMSGTWVDLETSDPQLTATTGNDGYTGTAASDLASGLAGDDQIFGEAGDDLLFGDAGDDTVRGGAGDDLMDGGSGYDTVDYGDSDVGVTVDLTDTQAQDTGAGKDTLSNFEAATGSSHSDTFRFTDASDGSTYSVEGGTGGHDTIDLSSYDVSDVTFSHGSLTVQTGNGGSFTVEYSNIDAIQFDSVTATVLTENVTESRFSGSALYVDGGQVFQVSVTGAGSIDFSYDAEEQSLTISDTDGTNSGSTVRVAEVMDSATDMLTIAGIAIDGDLGALETTADIGQLTLHAGRHDLSSVTVGGGSGVIHNFVMTTGDFDNTAPMTVNADIAFMSVTMDMEWDFTVNGDIGRFAVGDDLGGTFMVNGSIGTLDIAEDIEGSNTHVTGDVGSILIAQKIYRSATVTVDGDVGSILTGNDIVGSTVAVGGDLGALEVGDDMASGSSVTVLGDAGFIEINDALSSSEISVGGDLESFRAGRLVGDSTLTALAVEGAFTLTDGAFTHSDIYGVPTRITYGGGGVLDLTIIGTDDADVLVGDDGNDTIYALAGDDTLAGGLGDDTLDGGDGFDTVDYSEAESAITVDLDAGTADGGAGEDQLTSIEAIVGSAFDDTLIGDADDNIIAGGAGDDNLDGGAGVDILSYADADAGVTVDLTTGSAVGGGGADAFEAFEGVEGSQHDDTFLFADPAPGSRYGVDGGGGMNTVDLTGFSLRDATFGTYSVNVATGDGQSFTVDFMNVQAMNFSDATLGDGPNQLLPAAVSTDEDSALIFSEHSGSAIHVAAWGDDELTMTLGVASGSLTLADNAGLTFLEGDGVADMGVTFRGSQDAINAALDGLRFDPDADANGSVTLTVGSFDGVDSTTDTVAITVNAVNDAPQHAVPEAQVVEEDALLVFSNDAGNSIRVTDADGDSAELTMTLSVDSGELTLARTTGLTFSAGDGITGAAMTFSGTQGAINAALDGLIFSAEADSTASVTLTVQSGDGSAVATDSVAIHVTPMNDAPVQAVPASQSIDEDSMLVFSSGGGNAITVNDVDLADGAAGPGSGASLRMTLAVTDGQLTLAQTAGLSFLDGDGVADEAMTFTGPVAVINAALDGAFFEPRPDFHGVASLTVTTDDQGNSGAGGVLTDTDTVAIVVNGTNDAPLNTVPEQQSIPEDTDLTFSTNDGNAIAVSDVDAGDLEVTIEVQHGTLSLAQVAGLAFSTGDGAADSTMMFGGSAAAINAALDGMMFSPDAGFHGPVTLTIATDDLGNGGGDARIDTDTVSVLVVPTNDAPVLTVPAAQALEEDGELVFSAATGNELLVADVDADTLQMSLSVEQGSLTLSQVNGLTFSSGDGLGAPSMVFTGAVADINAALDGLLYRPEADSHTPAALTIRVNDQSPIGALADTDTVAITVAAVNDAPVHHVPDAQSVNEDNALTFSVAAGNAITVSDVDDNGMALEVEISVADGRLTLGQTSGVLFSVGDGVSDETMVFTGSMGQINAALDGAFYEPDANFSGTAALTITTSDRGNGGGDARVDTDTVAIHVHAINDAPLAEAGPDQQVTEGALVALDASSSRDVDSSLSYSWTQIAGPHVDFFDTEWPMPSFVAPDVTADTVLTFEVTVSDGVHTAKDTVSVTIQPAYVMGTDGKDHLVGGSGHDNIRALAGNDTIRGGGGDDVIEGGAGHDRVDYAAAAQGVDVDVTRDGVAQDTGAGRQTLTDVEGAMGSSHDDVFRLSQPTAGEKYQFSGGDGRDRLDLSAYSMHAVTFSDGALSVDMVGGGTFTVAFDGLEVIELSGQLINVVSGDMALLGLTGTHVFLDGDNLFQVSSSSGSVDVAYDASLDTLSVVGTADTDATTDLLIRDLQGGDLSVADINLQSKIGTLTVDRDVDRIHIGAGAAVTRVVIDGETGFLARLEMDESLTAAMTVAAEVDTVELAGDVRSTLTLGGNVDSITIAGAISGGGSLAVDGALGNLELSRIGDHTAVHVGGDLGALTTTEIGAGVRFVVGGDAWGVSVSGGVGTAAGLATLEVIGDVVAFTAAGDVHGSLKVGGQLTSLTTLGTASLHGSLRADQIDFMTIGGDLTARVDVADNMDYLAVSGGMTGPGGVYVGGSVDEVTVNGLAAKHIQVDGDLRLFDAPQDFTGVLVVERAFGELQIRDGAHVVDRDFSSEERLVYDGGADRTTHASLPPLVAVGDPITIDELQRVTLSVSTWDAEGEELAISWRQLAGPPVELHGADTEVPTFVAPNVAAGDPDELVFEVAVRDGTHTVTDRVSVFVNNVNDGPQVYAGDDLVVEGGAPLTLSPYGFDADGDELSYRWTQVAGPTVIFDDLTSAAPTFLAPQAPDVVRLTFQVEVSDGTDTATDRITVTVQPDPSLQLDRDDTAPVAGDPAPSGRERAGAGRSGSDDPFASATDKLRSVLNLRLDPALDDGVDAIEFDAESLEVALAAVGVTRPQAEAAAVTPEVIGKVDWEQIKSLLAERGEGENDSERWRQLIAEAENSGRGFGDVFQEELEVFWDQDGNSRDKLASLANGDSGSNAALLWTVLRGLSGSVKSETETREEAEHASQRQRSTRSR